MLSLSIMKMKNLSTSLLYANSSDPNLFLYLEQEMGPRTPATVVLVILTVLYSSVFLSGTVGSISICFIILKTWYLRTATNYYLLSLAFSELLVLLSGLPPELYSIWEAYPWRFGEPFCVFKAFLSEMTSYASVLTITAFTVERYVAICHPIKAQTLSNLSRATKIIIMIWIIACICALPYPLHTRQFYYVDHPVTGLPLRNSLQCNIPFKWKQRMTYVFQISTFLFFVAPMALITVMYVMIGVRLNKSDFNEKSSRNGGTSNTTAKTKARKAVIKMLVAVVVAFFICWAPFHAQRLMTLYVPQKKWTADLIQVQSNLFYISGVLYFFSSTVNPILYNLMSKKFRRAFKNTLCRCCYTMDELRELRGGGSRSVLYSDRSTFITRPSCRGSSPQLVSKYSNGMLPMQPPSPCDIPRTDTLSVTKMRTCASRGVAVDTVPCGIGPHGEEETVNHFFSSTRGGSIHRFAGQAEDVELVVQKKRPKLLRHCKSQPILLTNGLKKNVSFV